MKGRDAGGWTGWAGGRTAVWMEDRRAHGGVMEDGRARCGSGCDGRVGEMDGAVGGTAQEDRAWRRDLTGGVDGAVDGRRGISPNNAYVKSSFGWLSRLIQLRSPPSAQAACAAASHVQSCLAAVSAHSCQSLSDGWRCGKAISAMAIRSGLSILEH